MNADVAAPESPAPAAPTAPGGGTTAGGAGTPRRDVLGPSLIPALVMLVVGAWRASNPALGWDENATLIVAQRSVGQILDLVGNTDGSIAPYYLFMHFWAGLFGTTEIALRVPSIIATAVGVGIVGELGRRLFTPGVGLLAGLLLTAVPQLSRYAQDARVYGIAFMLVALSTLLLYRAVQRPTWRRWLCYGAAVLLVGLAHLLGLTILVGHAVVVMHRWARRRDPDLRRWVPVTAAAVAAASPVIVLGLGQRERQLAWIEPVTLGTLREAPGALFGLGTMAWLFIALAVLARWSDRRIPVELAVMAAAPPAILLGASLVTDSLWVPRYVLFTVAPISLLAAVTVRRYLTHPALLALVVAAVAALGVPAQLAVRGPATHHGPDFRQIASTIRDNQRPGDGIVYGGPSNWSLRAGVDYYLAGETAPRDLLLARPAAEVGQLRAQECRDTAACVGATPRIWLVRLYRQDDPLQGSGAIAAVLRAQYKPVRVWQITKGTVALYERRG